MKIAIKYKNFNYAYKILDREIYKIICNEITKINPKVKTKSLYEILEFSENYFEENKRDIVQQYYFNLQNDICLEADINNLMEILYLVKKW